MELLKNSNLESKPHDWEIFFCLCIHLHFTLWHFSNEIYCNSVTFSWYIQSLPECLEC